MWEKLQTLTDMTAGIIPLMLLLFTVALAVIIERLYFFHKVLSQGAAMERDLKRAPYRGIEQLGAVVKANPGALQSALVTAALESQSPDADAMERHVDETILETVPAMDKHLWVLDTAVTLNPLMGLLGTIFGMIKTFDVLGGDGLGAGAKAVTGGIGEALVATGIGLFIAIVGLIFLNYFNKRVRLGVHQLELIKLTLVNRMHGGGAKG
jgi:biopolymer transport protein ExbB